MGPSAMMGGAGEDDAPPQPAGQGADPGAKEMGEGGIIHIPKDMLPPGMSEKVKEGDILEFRAIGPADAEGDIPVEYNTGEPEEKAPEWEEDFRKEMSPQKENAQPEVPEDSSGAGEGGGY